MIQWNRYYQFTNEEAGFSEVKSCASECKAQFSSRHSPHPFEVPCRWLGKVLNKDILEWGGFDPTFLGPHPSPPFGVSNASNCLSLNLPSWHSFLCLLFYSRRPPRLSSLLICSTIPFRKLRFQGFSFCSVMTFTQPSSDLLSPPFGLHFKLPGEAVPTHITSRISSFWWITHLCQSHQATLFLRIWNSSIRPLPVTSAPLIHIGTKVFGEFLQESSRILISSSLYLKSSPRPSPHLFLPSVMVFKYAH